ncbi:MAG: enoyl-CoA hydratase/isomerase family protein [Planctomycetes bacterium]|nr:enoyl-CoA hydratase/isomerase family protein [Planctomycetota bacterium]
MDLSELNALASTGAWRLEDDGDGILRLVFDLPGEKVNKLTAAALEDLDRVLERLGREAALKALIVWGGKETSGTFIAGADIGEIRAVTNASEATEKARRGQAVLGRLASLPAVTVAAIHGNCLGGGTELALACDLRIASLSPKTRIGLPEVQLGILPGFGGTQRLPRLVGIQRALPVILQGRALRPDEALKIGLVDAIAYPDLLRAEARQLANRALSGGGKRWRPGRRQRPLVTRLLEGSGWGRALIRAQARKAIAKLTGGHYPAPCKALDSSIDGFGRSLEAGLELEADLVGELVASPVSKCLIDLFLSSEEARKGKRGAPEAAVPPRLACRHRGRIGVLGAGVMGGGITALCAQKGFRVRMKDIVPEALQTGLRKVHEVLQGQVKRRRMTRREAANVMAAISVATDYSGLEGASVVIEAVVESMDVKKKVLRDVEDAAPLEALLASNTSALSISELQSALARPERVVGLHFFNPVDRMPLVEVVRGRLTSEENLVRAETLARDLGKVPVRVEDGPGFLVNRLLAPYLNEAVRLFEEGYSPVAVDGAARRFGMPMGPFELLDEVGLDVAAKVAHILHEALGDRARPPDLLARLQGEASLLGKKSGKGFYIHGGRRLPWRRGPVPNPAALRLGGTGGRGFLEDDPDRWVARLVYPMVNEAARALDEKVVERPSLVDLAMVMGTGFAPFRGGPLRYADGLGADAIASFLEGLGEPRHRPCDLLLRLAREKGRFYDLERARLVTVA